MPQQSSDLNPAVVFTSAAVFRVRAVQPSDGETIAIPRRIFDELLSVVHLASKAEGRLREDESLTIASDGSEFIATRSSKLTGQCIGRGPTLLRAIAAAAHESDLAIDKLLR